MEQSFTLIQQLDQKETLSIKDLKDQLENGKDPVKIEAMKTILASMLNGESLNDLLMHVIRFVMPSKNKALKKLCVLYWEICQKHNQDGTARPEMVLVCNALRNDILHPNEFIRGQSLRLLCKLKETEILEPLVPSVRQCLEHKHPYVRKNAVLAIYSIFKRHQYLIPDASDLEADQGARRNALLMLLNCDLPQAVRYYHETAPSIPNFDSQLQLIFIEIIRKDCRSEKADKAKYIQTILALLVATNATVRYEAAGTLVYISSHASAIKAAANCYVELAFKESDNNVKLIVLDQLHELHKKHDRMFEDSVMDILRIVSSPDLSVRKKCLSIAMDLISNRNVAEVIEFLKKQLQKTMQEAYEKNAEYRQVLVKTIHQCAIKFPSVADSVINVLLEFLTDDAKTAQVDVVAFVKEVMERFPHLRDNILKNVIEALSDIKTAPTMRGVLWVIGEYAMDAESIQMAADQIQSAVGKIPIIDSEDSIEETKMEENHTKVAQTHQRVLADGTYATETQYSSVKSPVLPITRTPIRQMLFAGDFYVAAVLATTLCKLSLRLTKVSQDNLLINSFKTRAMLILTSIVRAGKSSKVSSQIDEDSYGRILFALRVLSSAQQEKTVIDSLLNESRQAFAHLIQSRDKQKKQSAHSNMKTKVDEVIGFRLLKNKHLDSNMQGDATDISLATGAGEEEDLYVSKLDRIVQLTGFTDQVYAEAYVTVHQFDIIMDILIINQTTDTLQNLTVEFSTLGDLKLVEKPVPHTIGPHGYHSLKINFKVSSTESGVIFGNIVYDGRISSDFKCVVMNDIHVDIMDYIKPRTCTEAQFRQMWEEFEWENKINVVTNIRDLKTYLDFVLSKTNMQLLTTVNVDKDCGFLAANMCAQSIFGEDALANMCLESTNGVVTGHIRIRSKTQGIALALGEKISTTQKFGK